MPEAAKTANAFKCCSRLIVYAGKTVKVVDEQFLEDSEYSEEPFVDFTKVIFSGRCPQCGATVADVPSS